MKNEIFAVILIALLATLTLVTGCSKKDTATKENLGNQDSLRVVNLISEYDAAQFLNSEIYRYTYPLNKEYATGKLLLSEVLISDIYEVSDHFYLTGETMSLTPVFIRLEISSEVAEDLLSCEFIDYLIIDEFYFKKFDFTLSADIISEEYPVGQGQYGEVQYSQHYEPTVALNGSEHFLLTGKALLAECGGSYID